jgi:predicted permease
MTANMWNFFSTLLQDVRFALRTLRKSPGFTCAALLTLALGIGANTAIYTIIDGVLLHPIPFANPEKLVAIYQKTPRSEKNSIPYLNFLEWQKQTQTFESIAGWRSDGFALTGRGAPEELMGMMVSENFFSVLRVEPLLGRTFTKDEDQRGGRRVVLLGEDFWKRRFAGDRSILGQTLTLEGNDYTVIGIAPRSIRLAGGDNTFQNDVFTALGQYEAFEFYSHGTGNGTLGIGRLKPGATLAEARAEMDTIMRNLAAEYPRDLGDQPTAQLISYRDDVIGNLQPILLALTTAVGFVLLIACTNVANLALARSTRRTDEFGIRVALGAARGRIIRQLLTESLVVSIAGGVIGVSLASLAENAALAVMPSALPPLADVQLNNRVFLFAFGLSLLTGILFGFAPALKASGLDVYETLKQGGRGALRTHRGAQRLLIIAEVAFTLILLVGTGLMIRSLHNLWNVDPGFNPQDVLTFYIGLSPERSSSPEKTRASFHELNERLAAIPGVESASLQMGGLPFMGNTTIGFRPDDGTDTGRPSESRPARFYAVGTEHFKTMGIRLLRGRGFNEDDKTASPLVTVVDEELARAAFPGQDPIGKRIRVGLFGPRPIEIVGVARHVKHMGLDSDATDKVRPQYYFSINQVPDRVLPLAATAVAGIVRSKVAPETLLASIRSELAAFESDRAIASERLMTDAIARTLARRRFSLIVLGTFAVIALALSIVGIYGVVSYLVSQRTDEIGLRMALGARPHTILLGVLREGGELGGIGVAIGLAGATGLTRLMTTLLFATSPTDLLTFSSASILLFGLTLLASTIPARRAVRIDPMTALRHD